MKNQAFVLTLGVILISILAAVAISTAQQKSRTTEKPVKITVGEYQLSGPYTHKNLSIFLVHGKNTFEGKTFITLQEAMVQKKVVVYETKSVNELAIENVSRSEEHTSELQSRLHLVCRLLLEK